MRRTAIELLAKIAGSDQLRQKCEAVGYTWTQNAGGTNLLDAAKLVAVVSAGNIVLQDGLSTGVKDRELTDEQWMAFVSLDHELETPRTGASKQRDQHWTD